MIHSAIKLHFQWLAGGLVAFEQMQLLFAYRVCVCLYILAEKDLHPNASNNSCLFFLAMLKRRVAFFPFLKLRTASFE